ncbi:MAG TPA: M48 family metallopeptidase [Nitrospiraceae bacterium]|jgi:predicted Zn-dependent protease|nr:M48 family metallopeptidase [Nitrospiraceae bacterium]
MNNMNKIMSLIAVVSVAVAGLIACETNPYTGRSQLLMMPISQELQLGAQAYAQVKNDPKVKLSQDPREVEPVKRVAQRVIEAAKRSKYAEMAKQFEWEVTVIKDDKTMNAFALPGGKIAVYTGIFPVAKNEAGLAAVMGHEVVHALARHGAERMSQNIVAQIGLEAANIALGASGGSPLLSQGAMAALGAGVQVGVLLPFSRAHESEADYIGLLLAAQAGYDPREAPRLWERMEQLSSGKSPSEFLSTHPSHGTRIQQLQQWMPEALALYPQNGLGLGSELPPIGGQ